MEKDAIDLNALHLPTLEFVRDHLRDLARPKSPAGLVDQVIQQVREHRGLPQIAAHDESGPVLVRHDVERGLAYIYLLGEKTPRGGAYRTLRADANINLDFDRDGCLIGIELLRSELLHPKLQATATAPGIGDRRTT